MVPFVWFFMVLIGAITFAPAATAGWKYAWGDEFNGATLDPSVWGFETGCCHNNESQFYTDRPQNSRIENGKLLIQALREPFGGKEYSSAKRTTQGKKSFLYGRFEIRCLIDIRQGSWPAWWWLPNSGGWPRGGEIDMMEFYQDQCLFNVMDGNQKWTSFTRAIPSLGGNRWAESYHTWTMIWDSTMIELSLDGRVLNHFDLAAADGTGPDGKNPFRSPGYLLLNQAIGGTKGLDPAGTAFPVNLRVDWIRLHTWVQGLSRTITVFGGTGSGAYVEGTAASLTAGMPPEGQVFDKWVQSGAPAKIDAANSATAILTVPTGDVTVTATFRPATLGVAKRGTAAGSAMPMGFGPGLFPWARSAEWSSAPWDIRGRVWIPVYASPKSK